MDADILRVMSFLKRTALAIPIGFAIVFVGGTAREVPSVPALWVALSVAWLAVVPWLLRRARSPRQADSTTTG